MAFRKRNVAINRTPNDPALEDSVNDSAPGVRSSSLTSHPVTSTGTASLDTLLGGHGGLLLGSSLLIGESGTTDFAGALLRYYASEGVCHGHVLHIVGVGDAWVRELPGVIDEKSGNPKETTTAGEKKMMIAWRYETLGQVSERGAWITYCTCVHMKESISTTYLSYSPQTDGKYSTS